MNEPKRRGRPPKARLEGQVAFEAEQHPDPVPGPNGEALARIVSFFKAEHPETWGAIALCPLQHGLDVMIERLR
jgi:hypothetical protein